MRACGGAGGSEIIPHSDVLRRKLRSESAGPEEHTMSPVKAARMSLARAADQAYGLALRVSGIRQSRVDLADMVDQLEEDWALFPLLHDDGAVGLIALDPSCVVAFVEQQMMGKVALNDREMRRLTRTDKALALTFVERFLSLFSNALEGAPTAHWTRGYRAEGAVETRHLMVLQLDASDFRGFHMTSEIVGASKSLSARLYLPIKDLPPKKGNPRSSTKSASGASKSEVGAKMRRAAMLAQVEMDAVMCKVSLPLSQLRDLRPGQLVKLPQNAAQFAQLRGGNGKTSLPVHLGQLHGMRAVRLMATQSSDTSVGAKETETPTLSQETVDPPKQNAPVAGDTKDELDELLEASKS